MSEKVENPSVSDGEGLALSMKSVGDRSKLAEAIRRGWAVDPARKAKYIAALDELIEKRDESVNLRDRAQLIIGANRIYQMEQDAALRDLQQLEKDARLDAGKATERIGGVDVSYSE